MAQLKHSSSVVYVQFPELLATLSKNGMSADSKRKEGDENLWHRSANGNASKKIEEKNYTPEQLEAVKK